MKMPAALRASRVRSTLKSAATKARPLYLAAGERTAVYRMTPAFIMIGASRSGTTTLFHSFGTHPEIARPPLHKGVRYFDLNYDKGWDWYRAHFPLRTPWRSGKRAFEASGYYLYHPLVPERMAADLPQIKLVAMVRDPVERAFSAWKHESARGFEDLPLSAALDAEDERLATAAQELARDPFANPHSLRHHSHRTRGEYIDQFERYLQYVDRSNLHVVVSERFFADPEQEYAQVLEFLGLPVVMPAEGFAKENARPSKPMPEDDRLRLAEHFQPYNDRLEKFLGYPLPWA